MKNYIKVKSKTDLSGFYVVYYGSTLNEKPGIYGISHLMEHLVCKGIDHLMGDFEKDGISWNAYTSDRDIVFFMTGLDEYVNKWKKKFYESILNFNITEEQFQNEKKIVLEEYTMSFNSQGESHFLNLYRKIFNIFGPIGLKQDLKKLTLKDCQEYFKIQYTKPHKIIDVTKYNHTETEKFFESVEYSNTVVNKKFDYIKNGKFIFEKGNDYKNESSIIDITKIISEDLPIVEFICRMLSGGLKSPLVQELREKRGLIYHVDCFLHEPINDAGIVIISMETTNKNRKKVQDIIQEVIENPRKYLTKKRFDIVYQYYEIKFRKEKESQHSAVNTFIYKTQSELELKIFTGDITYKKVLEVYEKYFNWKDFYKSVDIKEFEKI